ncbi:helix-turn-helix domain-containing protein [uncultured Erwinia sp.]|uniref:helix-turn-helix domain-containing protein n=1 Tax=uncultured Erwinia sp. TaxID=246798 RepID=UPI0025909CA8|nr:helix-turn-helix domain-containing protein [uncultured Erwinia sp.]
MSRLLINENPLQVLPSLACAIGLNEAVVLQQIHYWMASSQHVHDGRRWVYNSVPSWQKQFPFWSESTVKRALLSLEKQGMVISGNYNRDPRDHSKWYSINYEALAALENSQKQVNDASGQFDPIEQVNLTRCNGSECTDAPGQNESVHQVNMTRPLPETTTENTQETNSENKTHGVQAEARTPAKRSCREYSPEFETAWQAYPKRAGANNKSAAGKAWAARIKSGVTASTMLAGVQRYAAFVAATGRSGTEYVKQAATFFGPDHHFDEAWDAPATPKRQTASQQKHSGFDSREYGQTQSPAWARGNQ